MGGASGLASVSKDTAALSGPRLCSRSCLGCIDLRTGDRRSARGVPYFFQQVLLGCGELSGGQQAAGDCRNPLGHTGRCIKNRQPPDGFGDTAFRTLSCSRPSTSAEGLPLDPYGRDARRGHPGKVGRRTSSESGPGYPVGAALTLGLRLLPVGAETRITRTRFLYARVRWTASSRRTLRGRIA
jgi:hypothetical protein